MSSKTRYFKNNKKEKCPSLSISVGINFLSSLFANHELSLIKNNIALNYKMY